MELPGMWEESDFMGGDPDERSHAFRDVGDTAQLCQWFAMCGHLATTTIPHPTLGDVPACDRCNARVEALKAS